MFEKRAFCEKWGFEIVNFVKNETLKMQILSKNEILKCEFLDKLRIFALVRSGAIEARAERVSKKIFFFLLSTFDAKKKLPEIEVSFTATKVSSDSRRDEK